MTQTFEDRVEEVLGALHGMAWPLLEEAEKTKLVGKVVRGVDKYGDTVAAWGRALGVPDGTLRDRIMRFRRQEPIDSPRTRSDRKNRLKRLNHAKAVLTDPNLAKEFVADPKIARLVAQVATDHVNSRPSMPREPRGLDLDDAWQTWLARMNAVLMDGAALMERTEDEDADLGAYAEAARLFYQRITEKQLDVELRELLESEEARG